MGCCGGAIWDLPSGGVVRQPDHELAVAEPASGDFTIYDDPAVQSAFVVADRGARETVLQIEGIRCAACAAANERALAALPGMIEARVNFSTHRATVRWDAARLKLSEILEAVKGAGYSAAPFNNAWLREGEGREQRDALWRLFVACFGMMQVMMYAVPVYLAGEGEITADIETLMRWASFTLTVPVVFYSAAPFYRGAWRGLRAGRMGMDVPVALGVVLAFGASLVATIAGGGEVYYDSVTMFVFLLLLGRYLELFARRRATEALRHLYRLVPAFAHRLESFPASLESRRVAAANVKPGDHLLVKPGESIPADGEVAQGQGSVSEAMLTGEARPVNKTAGAPLTGGSVNLESPLVMRVTRVGTDTVLSSILRLVERGGAEKPPVVAVADRVASHFVFVVLALALVAGVYWSAADPARAVLVVVAVLVATCPCALSLAMPAALTVATGAMAKRGLIACRGRAIESLAGVTDVVFDKTGTLTLGQPRLKSMAVMGEQGPGGLTSQDALALARAMEAGSEHPLAHALRAGASYGASHSLRACASYGASHSLRAGASYGASHALRTGGPAQEAEPVRIESLANIPGMGLEAVIDGWRFRLGSAAFACGSQSHPELLRAVSAHCDTEVILGDGSAPFALFQFEDAPRPEARSLVRSLQIRGLTVHLLSGDGHAPAEALATQLGIDRVEAAASPQRKLEYLRALQARGRRVLMVGDGINDTPAIAAADVSVAMGGGTRLAQTSADAVLLSGDLRGLDEGMEIARRTLRVIRQNVAWAFAYNLLVLPMAIAGYLTPWAAAIGMSASSLVVVLNALRIQTGNGSRAEDEPPGNKLVAGGT